MRRSMMKKQALEVKVALQILKPVNTVFEAIIDPAEMSNYFISKSSGRMIEGKELRWSFPEFEEEFPIRVGKIEQDEYISYYWDTDGKELLVEMLFTPVDGKATIVTITERGMDNDEAGIQWLMRNTGGGPTSSPV